MAHSNPQPIPIAAAEIALRDSEERYRFVTEALPIHVWFGTQGGFEYCNRHLLEFTGLTFEQIRAGESLKLIHPDDFGRVLAATRRSFETGEEFAQEYRVRRRDGVYRWVLAQSRRFLDFKGEVKWLGVSIDITDRRGAEDALRAANDRLSLALETARMGAWEWDIESDRVWWSDQVAHIHGIRPETFAGTFEGWINTIHPDDRQRARDAIARVLAGDGNYEGEYRKLRPDGAVCWTFTRAIVTRNAEGKPARLLGVSMDITSRKQSEEALRRSEKLATTGRMAATIAHEINNPLEAVVNIVYVAQTDPGTPPHIRELLADADHELRHVAHIVRQTLGFYREDSAPAPIDAVALVQDVADLYRRKLLAKSLRFSCELPGHLPTHGVAGELRQVISNMMANAIDAAPIQGEIRVLGSSKDGVCEVSVCDNGPGVEARHLSALFEPFFTTKRDVGTGLGLWVSRQLAEKHNGTLRYERIGAETRFVLRLPSHSE